MIFKWKVPGNVAHFRNASAPDRAFSIVRGTRRLARRRLSGCRIEPNPGMGHNMALDLLVIMVVLVVIYLFYAVIHPERF
jgi:K+-transporting ATPase KdpF subunit